jgi:Halocarboxylic acid dehydrogenase DehI
VPESSEKTNRRELDVPEVPENKASGEVADVYGRIKDTLRAGVVNFVWRAFASKPRFLTAVWERLEPCVDEGFMEAADAIRAMAIERVRESQVIPDHRALLGDDLHEATQELRVFLEVNPRLAILTSAMRLSWNGAEVGGHRAPVPAEAAVPQWHPDIETKEPTFGDLKAVYADIEETLDLPAPNTDYRALGKWPDYLTRAWGDLKPFVGTEAWSAITRSIEWNARIAAVALPERLRISPEDAADLGLEPGEVEEVGSWIGAFDSILPELIVNTSWLWLGMNGGVAAIDTEGHPAFEKAAG